jgi:hypothetical protein
LLSWRALYLSHTASEQAPLRKEAAIPAAPACTPEKIAEVLAPIGRDEPNRRASLDCSLTLSGTDVVTKHLLLEGPAASGVTIDCQGATLKGPHPTLAIRSKKSGDPEYEPPRGILIKNCRIIGSVSAGIGMKRVAVKPFTRTPDYVANVRRYSPAMITLDGVTITATPGPKGLSTTPLYIYAGVSGFALVNSEINGASDNVAIYLDAESTGNTIKRNRIQAATKREVMAIDGSSHNMIINNWFSGLGKGGIFLYRNCGEDGAVRHSTPSHNRIINNVFYYDKYGGPKLSVYFGSRDGQQGYLRQRQGPPRRQRLG